MSKSQRAEKQRAIQRVLDAGQALSNIAYNLAQRSESPTERRLFDECRRDWDAARNEYRRVVNKPTPAKDARK